MKKYEFNHPPAENIPMVRNWTRIMQLCIALLLAMVVGVNIGGCTQRQIAGRAPTAPALEPVSTRVYSVRLGTIESPLDRTGTITYDSEVLDGSMVPTPRD
ncbi:MAG: hypothetical protein CMJ36_03375 [Phycisphaerae bacterium]|nr:hypothetical protein [Phycisphaerae bacterium]